VYAYQSEDKMKNRDDAAYNKFRKYVNTLCIDFFALQTTRGYISAAEPIIREEATISNPQFGKMFLNVSARDNLGLILDIKYKNKSINTHAYKFCCTEFSDLERLMDAYTLADSSNHMNDISGLDNKRVRVSLIKDPHGINCELMVVGIDPLQ
jgi:ABC-type lipopolysaccharide export system ATPase subunit